MTLTRFASVITLSTTRTADPLAAGIERFVGLDDSLKAFEKIDRLYNRNRGAP
jgi:hypothetical protein